MAISHNSPVKKIQKSIISRSQSSVSATDRGGIAIGDDPDDVWNKTRAACVKAVMKTLETEKNRHKDVEWRESPQSAASKYEQCLFKKNSYSLNAYKLRFRKDLTALKNSKTEFALDILAGELDIDDFVSFDEKDLISKKQQAKDSKLLDEELKNKMGKQFPTNINQIKNQNVFIGEKWGISESAAKIDPDFDED